MFHEEEPSGPSILALLAEEWTVAVIGALADPALRPSELERVLPQAGHSLLMNRLGQLSLKHAVVNRRSAGLPPHAHYSLTCAGHELLAIVADAERWERRFRSAGDAGEGVWALRTVADRRTLAMLCALAGGPLSSRELADRVGHIARSTLTRRLERLTQAAILVRESHSAPARHRLSEGARRLSILPLRATYWEWRFSHPADPQLASDLAGLVSLLAPLAKPPARLRGSCELRVDDARARRPGLHVDVASGEIRRALHAPAEEPRASGRASPAAWCEALLLRRPQAIETSGDGVLLASVLGALSDVLLD
jgi:DNA-binding HxlR family transcriptional regulator